MKKVIGIIMWKVKVDCVSGEGVVQTLSEIETAKASHLLIFHRS